MIAFLLIVYSAIVITLFKLKIVKPRPAPLAVIAVVGLLMIGGVVVAWTMCAPLTPRVVTTQYVVQLVPYVKGQVKKVHALANQPIKKGDLLLEINPEPYQYALNQVEAQFQAAQENIQQSQAGLEVAQANVAKAGAGIEQAQATIRSADAGIANAQAAVTKAVAGVADAQAALTKAQAMDELAKTEETIALNLQKADAGAISTLRVVQMQQNRQAADAAVTQATTGVSQAEAARSEAAAGLQQSQAGLQQAQAALVAAQSTDAQARAAERQAMREGQR